MPVGRASLALLAYAAVFLAAVMAVYFIGTGIGLTDLPIAGLEVLLALVLVAIILRSSRIDIGPVMRNRSLVLIYCSYFAVLWNLWFFSFWSVAIIADVSKTSFLYAAVVAAFNA